MWHFAFEAVEDLFAGDFGNRQGDATQVVLFVTDGFPSAEVNASIALAESIRDSGATIITVQVEEVRIDTWLLGRFPAIFALGWLGVLNASR